MKTLIRRTLPIIGAIVVGVACPVQGQKSVSAKPATDSLGRVIVTVEARLAPLSAFRDSIVRVLRPDSGTKRADSAFLGLREQYNRLVASTWKSVDGTVFHRPAGAAYGRGDARDNPDSATVASDVVTSRTLRANGIVLNEDEGDFEPSGDSLLAATARRFVTPLMREFLRFVTLEETNRCCGDAAVGISWNDFSDRLAKLDRVLAGYPDFPRGDTLAILDRRYLGIYLTGTDNTPAFRSRNKPLDPSLRASFRRYVATYPDLPSAKIVADYLTLLKETGYRLSPRVIQFLREHHGAMYYRP